MDMKANIGSFAAALKDKDVWVMNVVPEEGPNQLKIIYDRGLIGTVHNWYVETIMFRIHHLLYRSQTSVLFAFNTIEIFAKMVETNDKAKDL